MPRAAGEIALILWIISVLGLAYAALGLSSGALSKRVTGFPVVIVISGSIGLAVVFGIISAWLNDGPLALRASRLVFVCMIVGNGASLLQRAMIDPWNGA
jgi:hypothetical protein